MSKYECIAAVFNDARNDGDIERMTGCFEVAMERLKALDAQADKSGREMQLANNHIARLTQQVEALQQYIPADVKAEQQRRQQEGVERLKEFGQKLVSVIGQKQLGEPDGRSKG